MRPIERAKIQSGQTVVLVADKRICEYDRSAGDRDTWNMILAFVRMNFRVFFLPLEYPDKKQKYFKEMRELGVTIIYSRSGDGLAEDLRCWLDENACLVDLFFLVRMETVQLLLPAIREREADAKIFYLIPDISWKRESEEAALNGDANLAAKAMAYKRSELALMARCDLNIVISEDEKNTYEKESDRIRLDVFQGLFADITQGAPSRRHRRDIVFIGNGRHRPNVDGLRWFIKEIWPLVRKLAPELRFHIVGSHLPEDIQKKHGLENIVFEGYVEDLGSFLNDMRLSVAPLRFGAGIKGKVAMSLGSGVPCVGTPVAMEGMGLCHGRDCLIASDPQNFANAIAHACEDDALWSRMATEGMKLCAAKFGVRANTLQFASLLWRWGAASAEAWRSLFSNLAPEFRTEAKGIPKVSIIFLHNSSGLRGCVNSLLSETQGLPSVEMFHISDEVNSSLPGVNVLNISSRMSDSQALFFAARRVRGKYILFFNPGHIALPGMLPLLVDVLDTVSSVAGVIPELLFSDSRAEGPGRESGGLADLFLQSPTDPNQHFPEMIPLLIRKDFFMDAGGFGEYGLNQLIKSARRRNMRLVMKPGALCVMDQTLPDYHARLKFHALLNGKYFVGEKALHTPPKLAKLRAHAQKASNALYLALRTQADPDYSLSQARCDLFRLARLKVRFKFLERQTSRLKAGNLDNVDIDEYSRQIEMAYKESCPTLVFVSSIRLQGVLDRIPADSRIILDCHDIFQAQTPGCAFHYAQECAALCCAHADMALASSDLDYALYGKFGMNGEIIFLPHGNLASQPTACRSSRGLAKIGIPVCAGFDPVKMRQLIQSVARSGLPRRTPFQLTFAIMEDSAISREELSEFDGLSWLCIQNLDQKIKSFYSSQDCIVFVSGSGLQTISCVAAGTPFICLASLGRELDSMHRLHQLYSFDPDLIVEELCNLSTHPWKLASLAKAGCQALQRQRLRLFDGLKRLRKLANESASRKD